MKKLAVGILAMTLVAFFAVPAMAEFQPYGSMRLAVGWWDFEQNDFEAGHDDNTILVELGDFSRFGAKWKGEELSGHVAFGIRGDGGHYDDEVYTYLFYGTWKFDGGSLTVGQTYDPYTFVSDQAAPRLEELGGHEIDAENQFIGYGALYDSRQPQIKVTLDNGLYLAAIQPDPEAGDLEVDFGRADFPKLAVGWEIKQDNMFLNPGFAWNQIQATAAAEGLDEEDLDSWLFYVNGKFAMGPADLKGSLHYGQNVGNFGLYNREAAAYAQPDGVGSFEDSDSYGGYVQVALPIDPATITLGVGYTQSENDMMSDGDTDDQMSYFINAKLPIADNFWVIPEVSYYDHGDDVARGDVDTEDGAEAWFAGALLRMDF